MADIAIMIAGRTVDPGSVPFHLEHLLSRDVHVGTVRTQCYTQFAHITVRLTGCDSMMGPAGLCCPISILRGSNEQTCVPRPDRDLSGPAFAGWTAGQEVERDGLSVSGGAMAGGENEGIRIERNRHSWLANFEPCRRRLQSFRELKRPGRLPAHRRIEEYEADVRALRSWIVQKGSSLIRLVQRYGVHDDG